MQPQMRRIANWERRSQITTLSRWFWEIRTGRTFFVRFVPARMCKQLRIATWLWGWILTRQIRQGGQFFCQTGAVYFGRMVRLSSGGTITLERATRHGTNCKSVAAAELLLLVTMRLHATEVSRWEQ